MPATSFDIWANGTPLEMLFRPAIEECKCKLAGRIQRVVRTKERGHANEEGSEPGCWGFIYGGPAERKFVYDIEKYHTSGFAATEDFGFLTGTQMVDEIPYPVPERLASLLRDPAIDPILPVSVRKPLVVTGISTSPVYVFYADYKLESLFPYPWKSCGRFLHRGVSLAMAAILWPKRGGCLFCICLFSAIPTI